MEQVTVNTTTKQWTAGLLLSLVGIVILCAGLYISEAQEGNTDA